MTNVTLERVWKIYNRGQKNSVVAVRDVSLEIQDGEFITVLGPSGCGKTSILRMIAGLEEISKGVIRIGNEIINNMSSSQRNIAMAFETYALYPHMNVRNNIGFCLRAKNCDQAEIDQRVNEIAEALHITDLLDKYPSELPGGQQQLISVARAMIREPNVFLLDEPFSHSDASRRVLIRTEVKRLVNRNKTTTILVTHDQHEAIAMSDRVVVMNFAEIQQVGTPMELIHKPSNMFVAGFVGEPAINFINCELKTEDDKPVLVGKEADARFPVSIEVMERLEMSRLSEFVIGIRPQELRLVSDDEAFINGQVDFFELLGENANLLVNSGEAQITAVIDPFTQIENNTAVGLVANHQEVFIFDPKTEDIISYGI